MISHGEGHRHVCPCSRDSNSCCAWKKASQARAFAHHLPAYDEAVERLLEFVLNWKRTPISGNGQVAFPFNLRWSGEV